MTDKQEERIVKLLNNILMYLKKISRKQPYKYDAYLKKPNKTR